jgi:hypothetical protein
MISIIKIISSEEMTTSPNDVVSGNKFSQEKIN